MKLNEKIRTLREMNHWSQEAVAEQMGMSKNGYAKIERGETRPNVDRLIQIAELFHIDIADLLDNNSMVFVVSDNNDSDNSGNIHYYGNTADIAAENEKLKLILAHKDEIIAYKDEMLAHKDVLIAQQRSELDTLKKLISGRTLHHPDN